MRFHEIQARPATPDSHPFVADVILSPTAFDEFERSMEDRQDVRLLGRIDQADRYLVHVGCSSAMVRRTIRDHWG